MADVPGGATGSDDLTETADDVARVLSDLHTRGTSRALTVHKLHTLANAEAAVDPMFAGLLRASAERIAGQDWSPTDAVPTNADHDGGPPQRAPERTAAPPDDTTTCSAATTTDLDTASRQVGPASPPDATDDRSTPPQPDWPAGFDPRRYLRTPLPDQRTDRDRNRPQENP